MTIHRDLTIESLAAIVCSALAAHEIDAVLTGGAVVSIYTHNAYESDDLDFVIRGIAKRVDDTMTSLGFHKDHGRYWVHPNTRYWVEFPRGPLEIGSEAVRTIAERETPAHPVDLRRIKGWSKREGQLTKHSEFVSRLEG